MECETHAHAAGAVIDHLGKLAAPCAKRFHDNADEALGSRQPEHFKRLRGGSRSSVRTTIFGFADRQIVQPSRRMVLMNIRW